MENKTDAALEILRAIPENELQQAGEYLSLLGFGTENNWQVIVKYNGDIEAVARQVGGAAQLLNNQFAVLTVPPARVGELVNYTEVEYIETPKPMVYNVTTSMPASCITQVQNSSLYDLKGRGVLLGIIDSGINYSHPDFRNEDGSTRIEYIWDQSISGNPPAGFLTGTEYNKNQINEALRQTTKSGMRQIVPSEDTVGHGTHVAGIAGGNGRGSNGTVVGAAPEAEFIIVKVAASDFTGFLRNVEIMLGIRYVLEKATELGRPVAINISIGMNSGSHDGNSLIEQYLNDAASTWKNNIVVGSGNEGLSRNHTMGEVSNNGIVSFQFQIGSNTKQYQFSLWQNALDQLAFEIIDPTGRQTPQIVYRQSVGQYGLGQTKVYTAFAGPSPLNGAVEFAVYLSAPGASEFVTTGVWTVNVIGQNVINGKFDVWGPTTEEGNPSNFFLSSTELTTLTTPSTAQFVITVGAYNDITGQIALFSGRGFDRDNVLVKPDLVAPGVEISAASHTTNGYRTLSGTSMATPHVTGGIALLMEWGIVQGNNPFLYGENVRTYLVRGATRTQALNYPNPSWGYGRLCIERSLDLLRQQLVLG